MQRKLILARPGPLRIVPPLVRPFRAAPSSGLFQSQRCHLVLAAIIEASLANILQQSEATLRGNADAVHQMRIELTRLRAAFHFFDPFLSVSLRMYLDPEIKWLAKRLGSARDIDVAIKLGKPSIEDRESWNKKRVLEYQRLNRTLKSNRYKLLVAGLRQATEDCRKLQSSKADRFVWTRLDDWIGKLTSRGKHLDCLSDKKLHHLRIQAKRLRHAADFLTHLSPQKKEMCQTVAKAARLLQKTLGDLNDARVHRQTAKRFKLPELSGLKKLRQQKARKRLLQTADDAVMKLRLSRPS